jgi:diacylglycerol kinase family enzyme
MLVANTRHVMTMPLFPAASPFDGRVEVLETGAGLPGRLLHAVATAARVLLHAPSARLEAAPAAARRLSVVFGTPEAVALDGETYEDVVRIELRVLQGGLRLFLPAGPLPATSP